MDMFVYGEVFLLILILEFGIWNLERWVGSFWGLGMGD
jgi:hypothetical protein